MLEKPLIDDARVRRALAPLALGLLLLAVWQAVCVTLQVPVYLVPSPAAIAATLAFVVAQRVDSAKPPTQVSAPAKPLQTKPTSPPRAERQVRLGSDPLDHHPASIGQRHPLEDSTRLADVLGEALEAAGQNDEALAAYTRAVRDLVGSGEGIYGMVDGYAEDVPAELLRVSTGDAAGQRGADKVRRVGNWVVRDQIHVDIEAVQILRQRRGISQAPPPIPPAIPPPVEGAGPSAPLAQATAPDMMVEMARRGLESDMRPSADELEKMGYRVRRGIGKTGVVAEIGEGGKVIAAFLDAGEIRDLLKTR